MENNEEFTKEQAIKLHRDMWKWITKQIARNKEPLYIDELKEKYIANHTEFESVNYDCFACEYAKQEQQKVFKNGMVLTDVNFVHWNGEQQVMKTATICACIITKLVLTNH